MIILFITDLGRYYVNWNYNLKSLYDSNEDNSVNDVYIAHSYEKDNLIVNNKLYPVVDLYRLITCLPVKTRGFQVQEK